MNKLYTNEELINQNQVIERIQLMMKDNYDKFLVLNIMFNKDNSSDEFLESWR